MARLHVWISGRVQGVFFRESTRHKADDLGINGWVRNLPDGRVEAVFEGPDDACELALAYVHKGPSSAQVDKVEVVRDEAEEGLSGFDVTW